MRLQVIGHSMKYQANHLPSSDEWLKWSALATKLCWLCWEDQYPKMTVSHCSKEVMETEKPKLWAPENAAIKTLPGIRGCHYFEAVQPCHQMCQNFTSLQSVYGISLHWKSGETIKEAIIHFILMRTYLSSNCPNGWLCTRLVNGSSWTTVWWYHLPSILNFQVISKFHLWILELTFKCFQTTA